MPPNAHGKGDSRLEVLGVTYGFSRQKVRAFQPTKRATFRRPLRRISWVTRNPWQRRRLVRSYALPILSWCGAWVNSPPQQRERLRNAVERATHGRIIEERSAFISWTCDPLLGAVMDPGFLLDLQTLRHSV